jgi:hypothetical protein
MNDFSSENVPIHVNCRLITPEDMRYLDTSEMIFGSDINVDDKVLPILTAGSNDKNFNIDSKFRNMVSLEVEDYIRNKPHIGREIIRTRISDVESSKPEGKPHTKNITIGNGSYNPEYQSLIIEFKFDKVLDIRNQN